MQAALTLEMEEPPMYPYYRVIKTLINARFKPGLEFNEAGILKLRAGVFDVDNYGEVNNGRQLTLMDLGRYDLGARVGLLELIKKKKWGLAVGGSSVRYRRRIPFLKKFELHSRVIGHDGRWFYFLQEMWRGESICSSALIKAGVISKDGLVPASTVMAEFPDVDWDGQLPEWAVAWIEAESQRPWPTHSIK